MASREPVRLNSLLRSACALVAAAGLLAPSAGTAATLSQVRIGTHEDHTRIVLELDEATSYRLTPPGAGGAQLQIQLDANSAARHVASRSPLVKAVRVTPSARGATVFVDLSEGGVGISEMILADPPRIVLDLTPAGVPIATRSMPAPTRAPEPTPPPAPTVAEAPSAPKTPPAEAMQPPSLSDPVPSDVAESRASAPADLQEIETAEAASLPAGDEEAPPALAEAVEETRKGVIAGSSSGGESEPGTAEPAVAPSKTPAEVVVRKPAASAPAVPPAAPASADTTWADRLSSPLGYAGIGIVLLLLVVLAVRRRRHEEDDDPLYAVMSADDAGEDQDGAHAAGMAWDQRDDEADDVEDANAAPATSFFDDEPVERDGAQQLSLSRSSREDAAAEPEAANDADSFFREPDPSAPLPVSDEHAPSLQPVPGDVTHLAAELGDRVQELERRLEQLTEARERLERQVAAQTEELRVQRAAIARTQRVVRSMTKGEDLATEPVPRAPQA